MGVFELVDKLAPFLVHDDGCIVGVDEFVVRGAPGAHRFDNFALQNFPLSAGKKGARFRDVAGARVKANPR